MFLCPLQSLTQLTCSYEAENQTRYLVCDLGNPMKSGTSVRADKAHMLSLALFRFCVSVQLSQVKSFWHSVNHTQTPNSFWIHLIKHTKCKSNFHVERLSLVSKSGGDISDKNSGSVWLFTICSWWGHNRAKFRKVLSVWWKTKYLN